MHKRGDLWAAPCSCRAPRLLGGAAGCSGPAPGVRGEGLGGAVLTRLRRSLGAKGRDRPCGAPAGRCAVGRGLRQAVAAASAA